VRILACALCIVALLPAMAAAAPATQSYRNTTLHYAISYPQNWSPLKVPGADFALMAKDRNVFLSITVAPGIMGAYRQQQVLSQSPFDSLFGSPNANLLNLPEISPLRLHGSVGTLWHASVMNPDGTLRAIYALLASYARHNYTVLGVVRNTRLPGAKQDTAALRTVMSSMAFFG
jgi:hypothetical protein